MIDPRSFVVREVLEGLTQPVGSRSELLQVLDRFVMLLIPRKELASLIAEQLVGMPELDSIKSPAAARMAAAIALSSIGNVDASPGESDPIGWEPPKLPMLRSRWLRRMSSGLLRVRIALGESFGLKHSPLLDRVDSRLTQYLWTVVCSHRLAWARDSDMPPALEGALAEMIVEASIGLPGLAEQVVLTTLGISGAEGIERNRVKLRLERAVEAGLRNEPAPNDLRHFRQQLEMETLSLGGILVPDDSGFVAPSVIVDADGPAQFFEANLANRWFVVTAEAAPSRMRMALSAA